MTKLPEKNVLDGNKQPRTTTGEMKSALGKLRDYLKELLGEDSSDKEAARQALGINLKQWAEQIDSKADSEEIQSAIQNKVDRSELEGKTLALEAEIAKQEAELKHLEGFLTGVLKKLSNERFVANAPAAVVDMERKKQADAESKIAALKESLAKLKK